jgi:enoyl-CoA hydratase/carnithine racemase
MTSSTLSPDLATGEVLFGVSDGIARVTLNRPAEGNLINYATMQAFIAALQAAHDSGASVLLVSGNGAHLTPGRDKKERVPGVTRADNLRLILRANELLTGFPGISVVAVQGEALGFGSGLAVQADLTIAADTAVLGFDELAAGLPPLVVLTYLYRLVSPKAADDLVLTARRLPAAEALSLGLVSRVVAEADLGVTVERTVAELAARDASALRLLKEFSTEAKRPGASRPDFGEHAVQRLVAWIEGDRS